MEERAEPSVWYVAGVAICIFATVILVANMFGANDAVVNIAAS